ncbi:MAG: hypothetical protein DKT66_16150 [Candidatus Melainabacteria bacterium]|nr:MAG: hypothetical protein DKT66_16150 [Candidatus Melainabacteria bacterium]
MGSFFRMLFLRANYGRFADLTVKSTILPSRNSAGRLPRYIKDFFLCSTIASYRAHSMWASSNVGMTRQGRLVTRDKVPTYLLGFQTLMVGIGQVPEY